MVTRARLSLLLPLALLVSSGAAFGAPDAQAPRVDAAPAPMCASPSMTNIPCESLSPQARQACDALDQVLAEQAARVLLEQRMPYTPSYSAPLSARTLRRSTLTADAARDSSALSKDRAARADQSLAAWVKDGAIQLAKAAEPSKPLATISLPANVDEVRLSVDDTRLIALISTKTSPEDWSGLGEGSPTLIIQVYELRDPSKPKLSAAHELSGVFVGAHHRKDHLYIIARHPQLGAAALAAQPEQTTQALAASLNWPKTSLSLQGEQAQRWPALHDRRVFEERSRALTRLADQLSSTDRAPSREARWPKARTTLVAQRGAQLKLALSCELLSPTPSQDATGVLSISTLNLAAPAAPMTHQGVLVPYEGATGPALTTLSEDALYIAMPYEPMSLLLERQERRALHPPKTRLLKLSLGAKTAQPILSAQADLQGRLAGPQAFAIDDQDVKLFLDGPTPKHYTLTHNLARKRLEIASELEPVKASEPLHAVSQEAQRLYIAYGSPARVAAYDLRDPEQPRKLAEIALPKPATKLLSQSPSKLSVWQRGAAQDDAPLLIDWSNPRAPKLDQ